MRALAIGILLFGSLWADETVSKIVSSSTHTQMLLKDGGSFGAGLHGQGELGSQPLNVVNPFMAESSLRSIQDLAVGHNFSLWVDAQGDLWASGNNSAQTLLSSSAVLTQPTVVTTNANLVASGPDFVYSVDRSGALWTWGKGTNGQLGDGTSTDRSEKIQVHAGPIKSISCGSQHGLFVTEQGELYGMGNNQYFALTSSATAIQPTPILMDTNVLEAKAGAKHTIYLKNDGSVWGIGSSSRGQLGVGSSTAVSTPRRIVNSGVSAVSAGQEHSLILTQLGNLFGTGANDRGQLGLGVTEDSLIFSVVSGNVSNLWAGDQRSYYLKDDGTIWSVGDNPFGQLGTGLLPYAQSWTNVLSANVQSVSASETYSLILKTDGSLWVVGDSGFGDGSIKTVPSLIMSANVKTVTVGRTHSLVILNDDTVWAFGKNPFGQLGDGSFVSRSQFVKVHNGPAQAVSAGESHSLILLNDGQLLGAGDNAEGQLGVTPSSTPSSASWIVIASQVTSISAGGFHNLYTTSDGKLWTTGRGNEGQLGTGAFDSISTPQQVTGITSQKYKATRFSSYVIDSASNLMVFGQNQFGQLGTGNTLNVNLPTRVAQNVTDVDASASHLVYTQTTGQAWVSGSGYLTPEAPSLEQQFLSPQTLALPSTNVITLFAGGTTNDNHTWALDGSQLLGLGHHKGGKLGLGQQSFRTVPVFIGGGRSLVSSTANIVIEEEEILEVNQDEVLDTDEILDQNTGPQLRQVSDSAGGCLLSL